MKAGVGKWKMENGKWKMENGRNGVEKMEEMEKNLQVIQ